MILFLSPLTLSPPFQPVVRSVRDIDNGSSRKYLYTIPIPQGHGFFPFSIPPTELNENVKARIPSPSGERMLILKEETDPSKKNNGKPRQVFEIWTKTAECLEHRIVLSKTLHGKVVNQPAGLGTISWSVDETAIVYCAERNLPETASFFEQGDDRNNKELGSEHELGYGKMERWGEKYTKMSGLSDMFVLHIRTGKISKVENVPKAKGDDDSTTMGGYLLGQACFSPCGTHVVYTAWDAGGGGEMPRRLGMVYCYNRPSKIYASPIKKLVQNMAAPMSQSRGSILMSSNDGNCICLTDSSRLARSPRFSPSKGNTSQLCFLASKKGFDTHNGPMNLNTMNWDVKSGKPSTSSARVLVDSSLDTWQPKDVTSVQVANLCFPGLYVSELPIHCCSADYLYTTTQWGSVQKVVRISLDDGTVSLVSVDIIRSSGQSTESVASQQLMCIDIDGGAVITESAPNRPAIVGYVSGRSLSRPNVSRKVEGFLVSEMAPISASSFSPTREREVLNLLNYNYEVFLMNMPADATEGGDEVPVQWIFMKPPRRDSSLPPLIVVPHGGPHSCTPTSFIPSYAYLCAKGYAILHVNYRGSSGFGQRALESLPGNVGTLDVEDLVHAVATITDAGWVDKKRIGICGGSHGGFLASHCIGQHPGMFKAAAMRNPVTNIATMTTATDIMDWCMVETLGKGHYNPRKFRGATSDELQSMWEASPVRYADEVIAPTLVALGMSDQRVPPSQGLEYYHSLRSNGVKTKLLQYDDDDHAIDHIKSEADLWINIKRWFDEHL